MAMSLERVYAVCKYYDEVVAVRLKHMRLTEVDKARFLHLRDMVVRLNVLIAEGRREKVMRWYGFIQGALWAYGIFLVDELKAHSNPDEPPPMKLPAQFGIQTPKPKI